MIRWYHFAFAGMCILYLAIPGYMVWQQERILKQGTPYRFRLQPMDPADAFRGRYLDLNLGVPLFPLRDTTLQYDQPVYLAIGRDNEGFGRFESLHRQPPLDKDYVKASINYISGEEVSVTLPDGLRRYYLNEKIAPLADQYYMNMWNATTRDTVLATIQLRVLNGRALVQSVFFEGAPVEEYVRKKAAASPQGN